MIRLNYVPKYEELNDYYGNPELEPGLPNPDFIRLHCILLRLPFPLRLSWGNHREINKVWVHELVAPAYKDALEEILEAVGLEWLRGDDYDITPEYDYWGGIHCYRALRGGTQLSTHSWAIAADHNPHLAPYKQKNPDGSWRNNQPPFIQEAFTKRGFISFPWDGMHFQAVQPLSSKAICDWNVIKEINGGA